MSTATDFLDRILDPVAECFTPEVARRLAELRADPQTQDRLDALAAKANEGRLTAEEEIAYRQAIDAIDLLAILQAKARAYLRRHP
jgi:CHASE3 domain sensor protein